MPTVEQMERAIAKKKLDDMQKKYILLEHRENMRISRITGVPFRIIKEWNSKCGDDMPITEYYPKNVYMVQNFRDWIGENHKELVGVFDNREERNRFMYGENPQFREETQKYKDLESEYKTSQRSFRNKEERDYLFARFLIGYDIDSFSIFDLYGTGSGHTEEEAMQYRAELLSIQSDFLENSGKYFTDEVKNIIPEWVPVADF